MFDKLGGFADLMRNAGKIREAVSQATESLGQVQTEGTAGGGAVTVKVNGRMEVLSVRIDPQTLAENDRELLEDLITAAANQAITKAREATIEHFQAAGANFPTPDLSALFGPGK